MFTKQLTEMKNPVTITITCSLLYIRKILENDMARNGCEFGDI